MKAQATIEFMLMFAAAIAFVTVLVIGVIHAKDLALKESGALTETIKMETLARSLEEYNNNGIAMVFDTGNMQYRVEGDCVKADYGNKTIVVEGLVRNAGTHIEPV